MNSEILTICDNLVISGHKIPVSFLQYDGNEETYITFQEMKKDDSFSADDALQNYATYYDFDVYSKEDYFEIIEKLKELMINGGWFWSPENDSGDMYETDTGYYHKTIVFYKERGVENG